MNSNLAENNGNKSGRGVLLAGGLAALLASACCLGPLVLITLGFSGVWIANLAALEAYQPAFIGAALVALFFAGKHIWRPAAQCEPGEVCSVPRVRLAYKFLFSGVCALVVLVLLFPFIAHRFY